MRFIFAFSAEPLQLRFLNWILDRDDIDKNVMMEAVRNKDSQFVDGISEFTRFQSEAKKYASKIGNSSNIFLDCIYDRCANDDDSFKYMFGEDNDKTRYVKCYGHILNELYDAFVNSEEFSKEGRFMQRAKAVFNGFKGKKTKLEQLVKDMNQILIDNNRNSGTEDDNDERTFEQKEEDSWKVLEENEEYSRGEWHVYRVDEYEDMRNVAGRCSEWCVARADSGRSYFYRTYTPPYYLFCKGKRNPWILMHIPSEQFKGLDDDKFEPDRPTSYEAIEIGRDFLDSMGELQNYYDDGEDFSVFNEDNEFSEEPELDDNSIIDSASDEELNRMLDNTGSPYTILRIVEATSGYDVIMKSLDKCDAHEVSFGDVAKVIFKKDLPKLVGTSRSIEIYDRMLDECDEYGNRGLKRRILGIVLVYVDDIGVVSHVIDKHCNGDEIAGIIYDVLNNSCSSAIIEWMLSHGMAETAKDILLKVKDSELFNSVIVHHADDVELMKWIMESRHLKEQFVVPLAKKTTNMEIIRLLAEKSYENRLGWDGEVASILWRKTNGDRKAEELLFKCYTKRSEETASLMLSKATTKEEKYEALRSGASHDEIIKCFDEDIDGMKWEGPRVGNDYPMFVLFRKEIDDRARLEKLFEKVGYDLGVVCEVMSENSMSPTVDDVIKAVSMFPSLTQSQVAVALKTIVVKGRHEILPTDKNRMLLKELLKKYNEDNVLANTIIAYSEDAEFVKWVIENFEASCHSIYRWMEYDRERQTPEMIRRLADALKSGNNTSMIPTVISLPGCPKDVIEMFRTETRNGNGYGDDSVYSIEEFRRGMLDDSDGFFEEHCRKNADHAVVIWELMKRCERNGTMLSRCIDLLLGYDFVSEGVKTYVLKLILEDDGEGGVDGGSQTLGRMIDWCIEHGVLASEIFCAKSATEEQVRKVVEATIDSPAWTGTVDKAVPSMTPLAKKVLNEYEEDGDIDVNWEGLVFNPESTSEDLSKAVDSIEENDSHPEKEVEALLKHKNCTKDVAERALECMDFNEYVEEGYDLKVILKWTGAGILAMKDGHGYDASSLIRSYDDLSLVAQNAGSEQELDDVLEYSGRIEDDGEDEDESNYRFTKMLRSIYQNKSCSLGYFEKMLDRFSETLSAEEDLQSYIDTHVSTLSSDDIDRICDKHDKLLMNEEKIVGSLEKCRNATEEQLLNLINKYNAVGNIMQMTFALDNGNTTEKVVLDMMELVKNDDAMDEIVSSKKATEAVYRKAVEMKMGKKSLETVMKNTGDKELSDRIGAMLEDESTKYGLASQINEENDIDRLKTLVIRMYRMSVHNSHDMYSSANMIRNVNNPRALELMSKTKNKDVLASVVGNPHTPEKTVLQILKKFQSKNIVTAATYRTEKSILLHAGCVTKNPDDIGRIFRRKENLRLFTPEDIMKMMKWNPSCKFDILKRTYFKLSDEQLLSLKKLKDKDVDWIVDAILKNNERDEREAKAGRIVHRMLKASRIIRNLLTD